MKRLFFVNRYFYPDHSATSCLLSELAFHLAATGHEIQIVTSRQRYDDPQAQLSPKETVNGVRVNRVPATRFGRRFLIGQGLDYLSFYVSAWRALNRLLAEDDVVIAMTDPPFVSIVAMCAARRRGAHLVNWLQAIYPEVGAELGFSVFSGPIGTVLRYVRDKTLLGAAANVVVGERMRERLASRGIPVDRLQVIHNWSDDKQIKSSGVSDNPLRRLWRLDDKFVIGYSGNLDRAHEFETILGASELLRHDPRIVFVFIGGGTRADELARIVHANRLDAMFRFIPYQDRELLKYSLAVPDVHWLSLKAEVESTIVPSKFYGIAAARRPTIAVMARDTEIARLLVQHHCGIVIEPGQIKPLAETISRLSGDPTLVSDMGANARAMLEAQFTQQRAFERWGDVLGCVAQRA